MSDETYLVEIVRSSLSGYTNRVVNEEAGASEFVNNRVDALDNQLTNLATFKVLAPGQVPARPSFVKLGEAPADKPIEWTGVILMDGRNVASQMFR